MDPKTTRDAIKASMKSSALDARGVTNMLFSMQEKEFWNAFTALQTAISKMKQAGMPHVPELPPEGGKAMGHFEEAYKQVQEGNDALTALFAKMGWR